MGKGLKRVANIDKTNNLVRQNGYGAPEEARKIVPQMDEPNTQYQQEETLFLVIMVP